MEINLNKKSILVTGSSKGIGRVIALTLAKAGASIWACARSKTDLTSLKKEMDKFGKGHGIINVDLMNEDGVFELTEALKNNQVQPDIIIHNLGGSLQIRDPLASADNFAEVWKYNLGVSIDLNRILIPQMKSRGWGRIIHLSSLSTTTYDGNLAYITAKCGLNGYVRGMGRELAKDGIVISAVAPGLVELKGRYFTDLKDNNPAQLEAYFDNHLPLRRMVQPEEVAKLILTLCSSIADPMSGSIIPIDGGGH
ncbi:SDR family oxidoreductase [Alphaproteobacteria bacterium]|nr:SDR family oxidoreductase [Alphaproteobacteria bacterium]